VDQVAPKGKFMKKYILIFILVVSIVSLCSLVLTVNAQSSVRDLLSNRYSDLKGEVTGSSLSSTPIQYVVVDIVRRVLMFLGLVTVIIIIYAGYLWLTAGGNADQVNKAKKYLINAVIGVVIVLGAFVFTRLVVTMVGGNTFGCTSSSQCPSGWQCSQTTHSCVWN